MKVSIVKCEDYDKVDDAIKKALDDIDFDIPKGKKILLKPNILGQHTPDQHITTHPKVVEAVLKIFKGNDMTIADSSGFYHEGGTMKALHMSGMKDAAEKYGAKLINLEKAGINALHDSKAVVYKDQEISKLVSDVDLVINLPKLKTHTLMKYTGAVKNLFGTIPGGKKQQLHNLAKKEEEFGQLLVDIYQNIKPGLNIMDAVVGLEGNGPGTAGKPRKTGLLLASRSTPALDIVASEIIGFKPMDIFTNRYCKERGLVGDVEVIGKKPKIAYKKPVNIKPPGFLIGWVMGQAVMEPYAVKKKCIKCAVCKKVCPVGAIEMRPYPVIDKRKCIHCYCCHENCPHKAMELKGSFLMQAINLIRGTK